MGCILELKVRHIKDWNQLLWVCTCDLVPPVPVPITRMRQKQEGEGHGEDWGGGVWHKALVEKLFSFGLGGLGGGAWGAACTWFVCICIHMQCLTHAHPKHRGG